MNDRQFGFSTKSFPRPFLPSPTPQSACTFDHIEDDDRPLVLQYIRNLSGLIGIVTDQSTLPQTNTQPTGLGHAVDYYLSAHGYTADAQRVIARAFKLNDTPDGFAGFLSGRGMAKREAVWLWQFINCQTD